MNDHYFRIGLPLDGAVCRSVPSMPANAIALVLLLTSAVLASAASAGDPPKINPKLLDLYKSEEFQSPGGGTLPYRLMEPAKIVAGQKYPLVLFLHGAGERGSDNRIQLVHGAAEFARVDRREKFPAFVLFPQCPKDLRWVESPWDLPSGRGEFPEAASMPMRLALELVDHLVEQFPIDTDRLYITGLSMGGQGSWYAAVAPPRRFAALLEVCGGGDPSWAERYDGIPIWAFHGQDDNVVPISRGREMVVALTEAGHHPEIRYVEYPKVKHDSWTRTYARDDVYDWLFSKRKQ